MYTPANLAAVCGAVTRQSAEVENYMNAVERVVHYSRGDNIEQEAPHDIPEARPSPAWPVAGAIKIENVTLSYRKNLPNVLKGKLMIVFAYI
jgi:ATP-binding cassette subfamily C (CFTR/MRP) protein 1